MLLLIDNYDSFTYNLEHYLSSLGAEVQVIRNDCIDLVGIQQLQPTHIVISPGPGRPEDAGISLDIINTFMGRVPILGVCLGHQCIVQALGGEIVGARQVMHAKTSNIVHCEQSIFKGLSNPLQVTRYHSLIAAAQSLAAELEVIAWTQWPDGQRDEIMAVQHVKHALYGVQFHPEAILTQQGHALLQNFLNSESDYALVGS